MAMSASSMATKIVNELKSKGLAAEETRPLNDWAAALATAVIEEISTKAQILITTGLIQVQGSPSAQANISPITIPAGSIT